MQTSVAWKHGFPNPLGTPPKPFGNTSQTLWRTFPNPLGNLPKAIGAPSQRLWEGYWSTMWGCESKEARLISSNKECNISAKDGTLNSKRSFGLKLSTVFNIIMRTVLLQQKKQTITRLFFIPGFHFYDGISLMCSYPGLTHLMVYHKFSHGFLGKCIVLGECYSLLQICTGVLKYVQKIFFLCINWKKYYLCAMDGKLILSTNIL